MTFSGSPCIRAILSDGFKIYVDIFFIVNICTDLILLLALAVILRAKKRLLPIFAAATLTAAIPIVQLMLPGNAVVSFIIRLAASFLACFIAFEGTSVIKLSVAFALFSSLSSLVAELLSRLYPMLDSLSFISEAGGSGGIIPLAVCLGASVLGACVSKALAGTKKRRRKQRVVLNVISDQKSVEMSAYCDSGNLLREPIGGLPVIITGSAKMKTIVPESLHNVFFSSKSAPYEPSLSDARRVRIIPIMSVGSVGARILFGYVPDRILIDGVEVSACIALDSTSESFGGCDALLPNALIK